MSLSVVYITVTMEKTFMLTKLTTEPEAINAGSTPLEERKKSSVSSSFTFLGSSRGCMYPEFVGKSSLCPVFVWSLRFLSSSSALCQPASRWPARTEGQLVLAG